MTTNGNKLPQEPAARDNNTSWTLKVGTQESTIQCNYGPLKSFHEGTADRKNLSNEQLARSILRNKSQGFVTKIQHVQTSLNSWDKSKGLNFGHQSLCTLLNLESL